MKTFAKYILTAALMLAPFYANAATRGITVLTIPITTTDTATVFTQEIPEGWIFTVAVGGDSSSSDWNSVSIDLQVKSNAEWITVSDFDDVTAATAVMIKASPGTEWRFNVTGGTAPALKATVVVIDPQVNG